jgi:hypothetical protein
MREMQRVVPREGWGTEWALHYGYENSVKNKGLNDMSVKWGNWGPEAGKR